MNPCAPRCEFCGAPMVQFDEDDSYVQCRDRCYGSRREEAAQRLEIEVYILDHELGGEG